MTAYATLADLANYGSLPAAVYAAMADAEKSAKLESASRTLDSYMAGDRWSPPFPNPGAELIRRTCHVATYDLICARGFNPETPTHQLVMKNYDDALSWARDVGAGRARPTSTVDQTPATSEGAASCESDAPRGWNG